MTDRQPDWAKFKLVFIGHCHGLEAQTNENFSSTLFQM